MSFKRDPRKTSVGLIIATERSGEPNLYGVQEDDDRYYITFLDEEGGRELCLSTLMSRPKLALLAARFIHATSLSIAHSSRENKLKLFNYIFDYLDVLDEIFGVDVRTVLDFDQDVVDGYKDYLEGEKKYKSNLKLSKGVKKQRYNFLIQTLNWARTAENYSGKTPEVISRSHLWSGAHRKTGGAEPLNAVQIINTRQACRSEIPFILESLSYGQASIQSAQLPYLRGKSVVPFKELPVKIASFAEVIDTHNPQVEQFRSEYAGLSRALRPPYGTIDEIAPYLFFTWRTIVPFIVILSLETGYNPSVQCGLEHSDACDHPLWPNTLRLAPKKHRAKGKIQVRTFRKDSTNPFALPSILSAVNQFTRRYRHLAAPRDRRHLFLVWSRMGDQPRPLINGKRDVDANFYRALRDFCERYKLGEWTLSSLRQTVADLVHLLSDGDTEAVKTMMGHNSVWTSERHYNSKGQKSRRAGQLAKAVRERQRFIDSKGKVALQESGDGMPDRAATPGFLCWDPFSSPIFGQKNGRLCSAYGCCPACPLACVQIDDPDVPVRFLQLKDLFLRTRDQTDHLRWAAHWNPQLEALVDIWLPTLNPAEVSAAADRILEPLPGLE